MKVVIIGSGNVATVLGKKIALAGNEIVQVVGRNLEEAHELGALLNAAVVYNPRYINPYADIYLLAVTDNAIETVASKLRLHDRILVHTAASVSKDVLKQSSENHGVIYPLQSLRKSVTSIPAIPVLVDGNNEQTQLTLAEFAEEWADSVQVANDEERLKLHVAAVFASNFTNHLLVVAEEFCDREHLKFSLLRPLIEETFLRIKETRPSTVQTGPAIRKDLLTVEKHQEILSAYPHFSELYNALTNNIIRFYSDKKP